MNECAVEAVAFLQEAGVDFIAGVPDSLLAPLVTAAQEVSGIELVIAPNEGSAVALGIGRFLGTGRLPIVFLQNSGLGNIVNPLLSLCHKEVYSLPLVLLVGWRGQVPDEDEPQHRAQGPATPELLATMDVPWRRLDSNVDVQEVLAWALSTATARHSPAALLISKTAFGGALGDPQCTQGVPRRSAIEAVLASAPAESIIVGSTGKISREIHELCRHRTELKPLLTIGGMGHCSMIALGLSEGQPSRWVVCLDGDGSFQMHMGAAALVGRRSPARFLHILLDNGVHESVGGHPVANDRLDYCLVAEACGYVTATRVDDLKQLTGALSSSLSTTGPHMIVVSTAVEKSYPLGRPVGHPTSWLGDYSQFRSDGRA